MPLTKHKSCLETKYAAGRISSHLPYPPEAFLGYRPSVRATAVGTFRSSDRCSLQSFVRHFALKLHLLIVSKTSEARHLDHTLYKQLRPEAGTP